MTKFGILLTVIIIVITSLGLTQNLKSEKSIVDSLLIKAESSIPGNPSNCINCSLKADSIAAESGFLKEQAKSAFLLGRAYQIIGNNSKAYKYFEIALAKFRKSENGIGIAQSSNYLGILSRFFGIYDSALEKHYNALQIYQNMKNENGIASTINYIGLVYRNLGNADKALNYYQQALKTIKRTKNYLTKSDILNNLGSLYWYAGDNDKALNYYHQALEIRKQFPEKADRIAGSLNNIGNVYRKMNKVSEAVKYYNESIKISEPIGDKNLISVTLKNLGISYLNLSRFMKAEEYFKKSLIISREINLKRIIEENLSNLARLYKLQKKYKLAQETQILYFEIKDSILNEKVHRVIADLQVKYETERKKKEIQFLEFEKQKNLRNLLVVISILVLLLTLVVFSMYRIKSRTNKLLRMKNQEISEKHKALNSLNLKLEESEYTYRYLFENNALPMLIYYSNSLEIAAVNNTAVELYGYSIDEFKKLHFSDIYLEWDFKNEPSLIKNIQQLINDEGVSQHKKKNGTVFYVELTSYPINFNGKKAHHVLVNDISDRLYAEMTMKESEEKFYNLFESTPDAILLLEEKSGKITDVNNAAATLLNCLKEQLIGQDYNSLQLPPINKMIENKNDEKQDVLLSQNEYQIKQLKTGKNIPVEISLQDYFVGDKTVQIVILRDIRERKKLEEQLHQSQKLEAIGQLAGGIAHDFNNLLTIIRGYSELILFKIEKADKLYGKIEQIDIAAQRAEALTRQLLAFSRKQIQKVSIINLNKIIIEMKKMLPRLIGENIEIVTNLDKKIGNIKADSSQIEQIVMNLIVNARDAMPNGGKIFVNTKEIFLNIGDIVPGRTDKDYFIELSIQDTGIGMDEETQSRIFEPFFTTKEKHRGTGLGLSTVYGIIKQSKGYTIVKSKIGEGTEFKVYLPKMYEKIEFEKKVVEDTISIDGFETVLVVEDEDEVRQIACASLRERKYKIMEAVDGEQAIEIYKKNINKIHLILTDVVMPKIGGKELADQIKKINPKIPILFMSGYTNGTIVHDGILDQETEFIQKPFTPAALTGKVRKVLDKNKS